MKKQEIVAKVGRGENVSAEAKVTIDIAENLEELENQYGEATVFAHARASIIVAAQGALRAKMTGKEPVKDHKKLQEFMNTWKPGTRVPGKPATEKLKETFTKLTPEQRKALLKELAAQK